MLVVIFVIAAAGNIPGHRTTSFTTNVDMAAGTIADAGDPPEFSGGMTASAWDAARDLYYAARMALERSPTYLSLASPSARYVKIVEGMRREEIADSLATQLNWSEAERDKFLETSARMHPVLAEGRYFPGVYLVSAGSGNKQLREAIAEKFKTEIEERYSTELAKQVPIETALNIAAIIQREAGTKQEMRTISGVIWNRIFKGMNLQMDATLSYAKGNEDIGWWPRVTPDDKRIESPYNTYKVKGLTPAPISNPGVAAVAAALNPRKTACFFYFHDERRNFYCSATYEGHVAKLKAIYGRGK